MENKKLMTLDEKNEILNRIVNIETNHSRKEYLKSIENDYLNNVYVAKAIINERYPMVDWDGVNIGVDVLLDDDLSIQSKEMEILYDYKDFINDSKTKQRNENSDFTSINLDINLDQLIELHNKQLGCVVITCKNANGSEVIVDTQFDFECNNNYILDEDLFNFFDMTLRTTFIKHTLKLI